METTTNDSPNDEEEEDNNDIEPDLEDNQCNPGITGERVAEGLVVATLIVDCDSESVGEGDDSSDVTQSECHPPSTTVTTTTRTTSVASTSVILEAKPVTLSHSIEDVLRHRRGKCCVVIFLACVSSVIGSITFFSVNKYIANHQPGQSTERPQSLQGSSQEESVFYTPLGGEEEGGMEIEIELEEETEANASRTDDLAATFPPATTLPTVPMPMPTPAPSSYFDGYVLSLLPFASTQEALKDQRSPQSKAMEWLLQDLSPSLSSPGSDSNSSNVTTWSMLYTEENDRLIIQRFALATFYFATLGKGWRFQQFWLSSRPECEWYTSHEGRSLSPPVCDEAGNYIRLVLVDNVLRGSLPPEVGLLTHLQQLQIQGDNFFHKDDEFLAGTLPTELGLLTRLELLDLSKNGLTGSIPSEFGRLSRLETLKLLENELTGEIPPELLGAVTCSAVDNATSCSSTRSLLQEIRLYDNHISGTLPTHWAHLSHSLRILDWSNNRFQGGLPSELSLLTGLNHLDLQGNLLTGTIATQLGLFPSLEFLKINDNKLSGGIPSELGNLDSPLSWLLLKNNQLTGTIPTELGRLNGLTWMLLDGNNLSGTIPTEFGLLNQLRFLRLHENNLVGPVPDQVCELQGKNWWFYMIEVDCEPVHCGCRVCVCS